MQNTHYLLVGTLSIGIPGKAIYYYYFTLVGYEIVIAYSEHYAPHWLFTTSYPTHTHGINYCLTVLLFGS